VENVHANTLLKILIIGAVDIGHVNIVPTNQLENIMKTIEIKLIYVEEIKTKQAMNKVL